MEAAVQEQTTTEPNRRWDEADEQIGVLRDLLQGGEILPTQLPTSSSHWTPEVRLAAAVLGQAIADIRWRRIDGRDHIQVNAALRWVRSTDSTWPFSFIRVCELLQLEPAWVRGRVSRWLRGTGDSGRAVVRQAA
jgi:hypothetical protein